MSEEKSTDWKNRLSGWAKRAQSSAGQLAQQAGDAAKRLSESEMAEKLGQAAQAAGAKAESFTQQAGHWSQQVAGNERVKAVRDALSKTPAWTETAKAAASIRESEAWKSLEQAANKAGESARGIAASAGERAGRVQADGAAVLGAIDTAVKHCEDRGKVVASAAEAFEKVGSQLDLLADGFSVGTWKEAGAGLAGVQGSELVFIPADGPVRAQLRVSRIVGQAARLAVGGQVGAYVACFYGPRSMLVRALERRGADLGLLMWAVGFFQTRIGEDKSKGGGWLVELAVGLSIGIPFISDFSAFEFEEIPLATYSLSEDEAAPFEAALAKAPDQKRLRGIARRLVDTP